MKVKKNDTVLVITGKDAGKTGKVLAAIPDASKIKVDGINVQKKSKKARSANETSKIVEQVGAIDASNVLVVCPSCGKATRVGHKIVDGKKVRICKKCSAVLDASVKSVKAAKAAPKKAAAKKSEAKADGAEKKTAAVKNDETAAKKTTTRKTAAKKTAEKTDSADKAE